MLSDFERLIIDYISEAVDNEPMSSVRYRLTRLLLNEWRQHGLVEMARLIVVMDEWDKRDDAERAH